MFRRLLTAVLLFMAIANAKAQQKDSFFVHDGMDGWTIHHKVKKGETIFTVARNYHIPPAMLGDANKINLRQALNPGTTLQIPLGAYNLKTESGMYTDEMRPLYYKLRAGESLKKIAKNSGITQKRLLDWNHMTPGDVYEGVTLKVGWLLYDATGTNIPVTNTPAAKTPETKPIAATKPTVISTPPPTRTYKPNEYITRDTIRITKPLENTDSSSEKSEAELLFEEQTLNGTITEKGPAVFFKSGNSNASFYYAFHNEAPKGSIIKVRNTNNGNVVYVKVLGTIPTTGMYHNATIGISSSARAELGVRDEKAWCELTYSK